VPWGVYDDPYPAPCGSNRIPSGRCTTQGTCGELGGFFVGRECAFYNVMDIGCCFDFPKLEKQQK